MWFLLACTASGPPRHSSPPAGTDTGAEVLPPAPDTGDPPDTDTLSDSAEDARDEALYQAFFDPTTVRELRLTISDDAIRSLNRDPSEWQVANLEIDGTALQDVGVRIKGSSTLRNFRTKPSLKFKLNMFQQGQKYGTLERITINNMVEDSALSREFLDYQVFNAGGSVASHVSFAHLWVNDEDYGLYTNLESMDDHWVERRYADPSGPLWEANDGADFTRGGARGWELASGTDGGELDAAITATQTRSGDFYADMNGIVDMDQFLGFWAWSIVVGNSDGYPYTSNDVFVYGDPADGRFDFAPWGMDEAWANSMNWRSAYCELGSRCLADEACAARLDAALLAALDSYDTMDVPAWAEAGFALTEDVIDSDPVYSASQIETGRAALLARLTTWPKQLRSQLETKGK